MEPGTRLGPYEIKEPLGKGGMGEVYRAHDTRLKRSVALKLVRRDRLGPGATEELLQEAQTAASLNHPHACTIYDVGEQDGQPYVGMEYVGGETLASVIPSGGLPAETVIRIGAQIASALSHAHSKGVVHRDLKPANVKLTPEGDAKVLDFGLALKLGDRQLESFRSSRTTLAEMEEGGADIAGTLPYMAPEVLRGEGADERSDLWALGVVLYETATGDLPFEGRTGFELTSAILKDPCPVLPEGIPSGLAAVIRRCLSKESTRRYRTAGEVQTALEMLGSGVVVADGEAAGEPTARQPAAEPPIPTRPLSLGSRRLPLMAIAAMVLLVTLAVVLDWGGVRSSLTGGGSADSGAGGSVPEIRSLAVLPLDNLSGDPEQEYFSDGMTEALTAELAQIGALKVISRTSAMQYKGADKLMPEIADELGVDALIEGSVLQAGDQVRITLQLVHGPTDRHLWSRSYQREMRDVLALQGEVARSIVEEIHVVLTPEEEARLAASTRVEPAALQAYLRGRFHWNKRTPGGLRRAIEHFERAVALDPDFADAHAGLADSWVLAPTFGIAAPRESAPQAKEAARRALALDPRSSAARAALAYTLTTFDWDFEAAEAEFAAALEADPNDATARFHRAANLAAMGRFAEAIAEARQAERLDPVSPIIGAAVAWMFHLAGRHEEAARQSRAVLELESYPIAYMRLGVAELHRGRELQAIEHLETAVAGTSRQASFLLGHLGRGYAAAGRRTEALGILDELEELSRHTYVSAYDVAVVHVGLGDRDQAFRWLENALTERSWSLAWLRVDPDLDPLRSDPRFDDLVRGMELPPPSSISSTTP